MEETPVLFPLYMAVGMSSFVVLGMLGTNIATLMAQEGIIVQITHSFILKYIYIKKVFFKCNISVKARDRKMDISIE